MNSSEVLVDAFGRVRDTVHRAVDGVDADGLTFRPYADGNTIAWLIWHLTRVQDDHVADVAGTDQVWSTGGWADAFALPFDRLATGYGQSSDDVAAVRVASGTLLTDYHDAVHQRTTEYLATLTDADLNTVIDERWDPPVTLGVRLISVISDDLQHAGQASYVRGMALAR